MRFCCFVPSFSLTPPDRGSINPTTLEICPGEVCLNQVAVTEVGTLKVCPRKVISAQIHETEIYFTQNGFMQVRSFQVCGTEAFAGCASKRSGVEFCFLALLG